MKPGQLKPNDFEFAILHRLARQEPFIVFSTRRLHVLSREFTGVGSYTKFELDEAASGSPARQIGLEARINMPGVANGMGAVLFCRGEQAECLEVYTYGDHWDGSYDGFSIEPAQ